MITEEELDALFEDVEANFESSDEDLMGVVIFVKMETRAYVYGIGSGKDSLVESMATMIKELQAGNALVPTGRGLN